MSLKAGDAHTGDYLLLVKYDMRKQGGIIMGTGW
jgi:hypothetical protein